MNITAKSSQLLNKQLASLGITDDDQFGFLKELGGAAIDWMRENPEVVVDMAAAGVDAGMNQKSSGEERSKNLGAHNYPSRSQVKVSPKEQARRNAINQYMGVLESMSGTMRVELVQRGIITPGAQLETIRNSFADMLYSSSWMGETKQAQKATLAFVIKQMDYGIASLDS